MASFDRADSVYAEAITCIVKENRMVPIFSRVLFIQTTYEKNCANQIALKRLYTLRIPFDSSKLNVNTLSKAHINVVNGINRSAMYKEVPMSAKVMRV